MIVRFWNITLYDWPTATKDAFFYKLNYCVSKTQRQQRYIKMSAAFPRVLRCDGACPKKKKKKNTHKPAETVAAILQLVQRPPIYRLSPFLLWGSVIERWNQGGGGRNEENDQYFALINNLHRCLNIQARRVLSRFKFFYMGPTPPPSVRLHPSPPPVLYLFPHH